MAGDTRFDYFVVLAEMRTGSNLLEATLNEFDGLTCEGEVFNPHFISHQDTEALHGVTLAERDRNPMALLLAIRAQPGLTGFRFFHDHDARVLPTVLQDPRCAKIVLTRNPLDSYVSLKIARATRQWKLGDVRTRRRAKATFDPAEFADHVQRAQAFQLQVLRQLQTTGQTAFHLNYDDLNDVAVLNGLAAWLGVDARITAPSDRLKRQNPEPLDEKLTNPEAVADGIARLDRFDLARPLTFEPRRGPVTWAYRACRTVPLVYVPLPGGDDSAVLDWMGAVDGAGADALLCDFTPRSWRDWQRANPHRMSFAVLRHPLARAHAVYRDQVVHGTRHAVRRYLARVHGAQIPPPEGMAAYDLAAHRAGFLAFLQFVKANLAGQTGIATAPAWASQTRLIEGASAEAPIHRLLHVHELGAALPALGGALGRALPEFAPPTPGPRRLTLAAIHDAEIAAAGRAAYAIDHERLGFGDWDGSEG